MNKFYFLLFLLVCASEAFAGQAIDERLLPPGVPRQMQVDGTNLGGNNPVNLRDTADLDVTNPSSGNVDITIKNSAVTDAKIAPTGITTRSKLPGTLGYEDEANIWTLTNLFNGAVQIGTIGSFSLSGSSSGTITIGRSANSGTYNFNLPTSAGTAGQPLLSGGGGSTAMSFGTLGLAHGGTNQSSWTAARCVRVNAGGTALESAAGDCGVGAGAIGEILGTSNEITVANGTGPTATISLSSSLNFGNKLFLGGSPLKFEGSSIDGFSTTLNVTNPTANRVVTFPNADSVTVQASTCPAGQRISAISAAGVITCETTAGTGDVTDVLGTTNEITITNSTGPQPQVGLSSTLDLSGKRLQGSSPLAFEGSSVDGFETTIVVTNPTADRTITFPNANTVTVVPSTAPTNQFATALSAAGVITYAQPAFSNLSGTATNAQLPTTLSSKTLDNTNTYTAHDNLFTFQDGGDPTRQGQLNLGSVTSGQTRSWTMPDANTSLLGNSISNTYTGTTTQDFSASTTTLRLPLKAMPGSPAIGELMIDGANLYWRDNSGTPTTQRAIKATEMDTASGVATLDTNARLIGRLQQFTVAGLPSTPGTNRLVIVNDAASATTCSSGGGSTRVLCIYDGDSWDVAFSGGGTGDVSSNTSSAIANEVVLFADAGGKLVKRATGTGVARLSSGQLSTGNVSLSSEVTGNLPIGNLNAGISASNSTFWRGDGQWTAVDLGTNVTGNLTVDHLNGGANASASTFWRGDGQWATAGTGTGDVSSNTATSVVNEVALFADTTGKLLKRATGTGKAKLVAGVMSPCGRTATATSYQILTTDCFVAVTDTSATRTITLPDLTTTDSGFEFTIADESNGAGAVPIEIVAGGSDTFLAGLSTPIRLDVSQGSATFFWSGATTSCCWRVR